MGKAEAGTPKAIANAIKSKGDDESLQSRKLNAEW